MASRQNCNGLEHLSIQDSSPPSTDDHSEQHDRPRIHFFDLPSEIRNHIYRYCVPTGYGVPILSESLRKSMKNCNERCAHLDNAKVTPDSSPPKRGTKMFLVSRQMRQEAASIYCSENFFVFDEMSAVAPFLQSQRSDLRGFISSIHLVLHSDGLRWCSYGGTSGSFTACLQAFKALAELPYLQVKHLRLGILDSSPDLVEKDHHFDFADIKWLAKLSEITSLESLTVAFRPDCDCCDCLETHLNSVEDRLWDFLAPKMLRMEEGRDHVHKQTNHPLPIPC